MNLLLVFALAMTPVGELRLSVPAGIGAGIPWFWVLLVSIIGNMVPAIILVYFFPILEPLRNRKDCIIWKWFDALLTHMEKKKATVEKYEWFGLILLVAIPFPGTGAYTGSFVSYLLRMDKKKSLFFILIGVTIAGIVMTLASTGVIQLFF